MFGLVTQIGQEECKENSNGSTKGNVHMYHRRSGGGGNGDIVDLIVNAKAFATVNRLAETGM